METKSLCSWHKNEFRWYQKANRADHYFLTEAYAELAHDIAVGSAILEGYEHLLAVGDQKNDKTVPVTEEERLEKKANMSIDEFFSELNKNNYEDELYGNF